MCEVILKNNDEELLNSIHDYFEGLSKSKKRYVFRQLGII